MKRLKLIGLMIALFSIVCVWPSPGNAAEKKVVTDRNNRKVEVATPAGRVVSLMQECTTVMLTLKAGDRLVGVDSQSADDLINKEAWFNQHPVQAVGMTKEPNIEMIAALKPDLILTWGGYGSELADQVQKSTGVPVVCLHTLTTIEGVKANYNLVAKLIGEEKRAEELLAYGDKWINRLRQVSDKLENSEKPKVHLLFWGFWNGVTRIPIYYDPVAIAGGINIASGQTSNVYGYSVKVPIEQLVVWNPDIILIHGSPMGWTPVPIEKVINDPRVRTVSAVKNKQVFFTLGMWRGWHYPRALTETLYMAARFHPEKYKDIDPVADGDQIYEFFYGKPGLWTMRGRELGFLD